MTMFPGMPQLHAQVIARMRERSMRKVTVGAILFFTNTELKERGRPTNNGIQALYHDIENQFVFGDPKELREAADEIRKDSALPGGSALTELADKLDNLARINEDRAKGKDPKVVADQITFSENYFKFKNQWDEFYAKILTNTAPDSEDGKANAQSIDLYDAEYRGNITGFEKHGGTLSAPPPPKSTTGDTELPDLGIGKALNAFPWGKAALFVGGALAVYWVINRPRSPTPMPEAPRRIGPPTVTSDEGVLVRAHEGQ